MALSTRIDCVDCGGTCHLLSHPDEDGTFHAGEVVAYRCADCLDRWDVVVDEADAGAPEPPPTSRRRRARRHRGGAAGTADT